MARDARRERVQAAAAGIVDQILSDAELVAWIAEEEIERQVAAGRLIRTETLQVVPGLELVPVGINARLRSALTALANNPKVAALKGKDITVLRTTAIELAGDTPPPAAPPEEDDEAVEEPPAAEAPAEAEAERRRKPFDMPEGEQPCAWDDGCKEIVDERQVRLSFIRWRKPLCVEHHKQSVKNDAA